VDICGCVQVLQDTPSLLSYYEAQQRVFFQKVLLSLNSIARSEVQHVRTAQRSGRRSSVRVADAHRGTRGQEAAQTSLAEPQLAASASQDRHPEDVQRRPASSETQGTR
jgi:hypothetical protein